MDILIGTIKHCERERVDAWATSASIFCKTAKKILLCLDATVPESLFDLIDLGFEIVHKPTPPQTNIDIMKFERHYVTQKYLESIEERDATVLVTDTLDVIFQADPFEWYRTNKTGKLLLGSEGIEIQRESWNHGIISKQFSHYVEDIKTNDVFCAGVVMGEIDLVQELMFYIFNFTKNTKSEESEGIDQAALQVILKSKFFKDNLQATNTSESFVVHCAVAGPTEQFVDWGFQRNYKYDLPRFENNVVVNKDNIPYCLVHQYNRVREWDKALKNRVYELSNQNISSDFYSIDSENSEDHWKPFNFKGKYVLDLGCGRWFGVENPSQYSPIWFGEQGATGVVGVDASTDDINYYTEYTKDNPKYTFVQQYINSTKDIENLLRKYPITAIKSDIEGYESHLLNIDVSLLKPITEMAIEYHSKDLRNAFIKKFEEWGYEIKTKARFSFANDTVGVLFAVKKENLEKNNALVICTTRGFTAYYKDWKQDLTISKDNYVLCDTTSGTTYPSNIALDFIQDNIINYNESNVKKSLNFDTQPSDVHWWNLGGGRSMMWFYAHLRMLYFYRVHPEYDYYWFFDDDVTFPNHQLKEFLDSHNHLDYDCMVTYLFSNIGNENPSNVPFVGPGMGSYHVPDYNWLIHYPGAGDKQPPYVTEKYGSFFPIVRFSNQAMRLLWQEHQKGYYGYSEGYVPTVLNYYGMKLYSIFNTESKVEANNNIIIHHKNWEMLWKNV